MVQRRSLSATLAWSSFRQPVADAPASARHQDRSSSLRCGRSVSTPAVIDAAHCREVRTACTPDGRTVDRMPALDASPTELLAKLEAVRLDCQESGCAERYLSHDGLAALHQVSFRADPEHGTGYHQRFSAYLARVQDADLTLGVAMTDAKGDRSKRPGAQDNPDVYVHVAQRRAGWHSDPRHQGHRHRRPVRARVTSDAVSHGDRGRRRLRGGVRGPGGCPRHHHGGAPGRAPR